MTSAPTTRPSPREQEPLTPLIQLPTCVPDHAAKVSSFFKALSDPTRVTILYLIASNPDNRVSSNALSQALSISAPTVTHHMKKLLSARLVTREQAGKWVYYSLHEEYADTVAKIFRAP